MVRSLIDQLDRLIEHAEADPRAALDEARAITETSDPVVAAVEHLAGLAHRLLGDFAAARTSLDRGFEIAGRAGDDDRAGRILLARSTVRLMIGDVDGCHRDVEEARALVAERSFVDVEVQAGAIAHRLGDHETATAHYGVAARMALDDDRPREVARIESNMGLLLTYEGRLAEAGEHLERARARFESLGLADDVLFVEHNLGYLRGLEGDTLAALRHFDSVTRLSQELGVPNPTADMDRAAVLASAGLFSDAYDVVTTALLAMDDPTDIADAELIASGAARAIGDFARSRDHASAALSHQMAQGRRGWVVSAELSFARARAALETGAVCLADIERLVDGLRDDGLWPFVHEALVFGAELALDEQDPVADGWVEQCHSGATSAGEHALAGSLTARRQTQLGNHGEALHAAEIAFDRLDAASASVGALDLWFSAHAMTEAVTEPAIAAARALGDEATVLRWIDRRLAARIDVAGRRIIDPALREHHAEARRLRAMVHDEIRSGGDTQSVGALLEALAAAERAAVDHARLSAGPVADATRASRATADSSTDSDVADGVEIVFGVVDGVVERWVVDRGEIRVHRIGPLDETSTLIATAHRRLRRDLRRGQPTTATRDVIARASELLFDGVEGTGPCTIVADRRLGHVPLAGLDALRDVPFVVAPSRSTARSARSRAQPDASRVTLAAGPGLRSASHEIATLAAHFPGSTVVADAICDDVVNGFESKIVHLACHGETARDNPLFTRLILGDGPLTIHELQASANVPALLVLSACDVGEAGEAIATADVLLGALGIRTVISAGYPVADDATAEVMDGWYRRFAAGASAAQAWADLRASGNPLAAAFSVRGADAVLAKAEG